MSHLSITTPGQLADFCQHLRQVDRIGLDTEFVSEDTFFPELCLIQVATAEEMAVIDPYLVGDLTEFWTVVADGEHTTIVHAAREELNFIMRAIERPYANLFDTQLAVAFCSNEYPSSYAAVITKLLGHKPAKGEQRTDWRKRPLTDAQIDYALEDVRYLLDVHTELIHRMEKAERLDWFAEEMAVWQQDVQDARHQQRWRKVSGIGNLRSRSLAIVRELWIWRRAEAERRDVPVRRVLRDDIIVELAKRKNDQPEKMRAIRGFHQGSKTNVINELSACVRRGLEVDLAVLGNTPRERMPPQLNLLGQFLAPALASICRNANIATSLVGTASDVRELVADRLGFGEPPSSKQKQRQGPRLSQGWRAQVVGNLIDDLLAGRKSIRIGSPRSEHPLEFDDVLEDDV